MNIHQNNLTHDLAQRVGAALFAVLTIVGATELVQEQRLATAPATVQAGFISSQHDDVMARAEGKGEAARMPEEFDVGIQANHVSGF